MPVYTLPNVYEGKVSRASSGTRRNLLERGFPLIASIVATPEVLLSMHEIREALRPSGIVPFPKVLVGPFQRRIFPRGYTEEERKLFRQFAKEARAANANIISRMLEPPTIDLASDERHLERRQSFDGMNCEAGKSFVRIEPNGDVFRCSLKTRLGNILDDTFLRRTTASPCDTRYCHFFCEKYTKRALQSKAASCSTMVRQLRRLYAVGSRIKATPKATHYVRRFFSN